MCAVNYNQVDEHDFLYVFLEQDQFMLLLIKI